MQNNNELQREADEAVRVLKEGGIILYPTDTVWGLGCDATNAEAVERVYKLKRSENARSRCSCCAPRPTWSCATSTGHRASPSR